MCVANSHSPGILVDVALLTTPDHSVTTVAQTLLPDVDHVRQLVVNFSSRPPAPTLPVIDPLIGCSHYDQYQQAEFDSEGRSQGARLAEAALALIRSDRRLASSSPNLLQIALSARILAQDASAVPGASRGFFAESTSIDYLVEVVREAEGALSFALAAFDDVSSTWHKSTVCMIQSGMTDDTADSLQRLLLTLALEIRDQTDDVVARTFRDVLGRHLRQSNEGDAEIWLSLAMTGLDSSESTRRSKLTRFRSNTRFGGDLGCKVVDTRFQSVHCFPESTS